MYAIPGRFDMEEAIASRDLESMESDSSVFPSEVLSPDDLAWADSCLVDDLEPSKGWDSWSSLNRALNEVNTVRRDTSPKRLRGVTFPIGDLSTSRTPEKRADSITWTNEETEKHPDFDRLMSDESDYLRNVFLPTYREDAWDDDRSNDSESLSAMGRWEEESESREEIFKVWNLDIPAEEDADDEFINELEKAFSESPFKLTPPKGLGKNSIDDVVSSMADLSLENHVNL
ncbi:OLC1v1002242C1 [Oldenlandia corymbosa var. corymbosa]|uniref:OLC1v1002242C1 n=1 Tax=Oldenlandia corymbosa var. corymbosa TaxID=529605 RepID=A0AAV1DAM7_OLDCO|nr:OLC1v1002242C1 [Oldenlandia corymbosa var. corymbosa]